MARIRNRPVSIKSTLTPRVCTRADAMSSTDPPSARAREPGGNVPFEQVGSVAGSKWRVVSVYFSASLRAPNAAP